MVSSKSRNSGKRDEKSVTASSNKGEVKVVRCPSAFPISSKSSSGKKRSRNPQQVNDSSKLPAKKEQAKSLLDWHDTVKEIREYGASAFVGKQKRDFQDEQYFQLTGRHKKKAQTPLPIVRGIKKAAAKREAKAREEARKAGVVLPKSKEVTKKRDKTYDNYGPAPSIGFVKGGIYKVQDKKKKSK